MRTLFLDTESTGLPAPDRKIHIVQLAWILDDGLRKTRQSGNFLIRPDAWTIPDEVVAIHGITTEIAAAYGVDLLEVMTRFAWALAEADRVVAHNIGFDWPLIVEAFEDCKMPVPTTSDLFCTQKNSARFVSSSSSRGPKLVNAYAHFTGLVLDNAHDALADAAACRRVYYGIMDAAK